MRSLLAVFGACALLHAGQALNAPNPNDPAFKLSFPKNFWFSTSTAAFQIEGAWNVSGKGQSIWDKLTHERPELILDHSNADVACDSYHKYKEDIKLAKSLGTNMYRFSLSWPRILPTGGLDIVNEDGIRYYNAVIDECVANGIEPLVTIFHWDLPQPLQDMGGLPNEALINYYVDFADLAFNEFGDRVKWWNTFNEPQAMCVHGYGTGKRAPAIQAEARADYLCAHTTLKAHAQAYHLYQKKYAAKQKGKIGFASVADSFFPKNPRNADDIAAADRWQEFYHGWFLHPIHSKTGDYPEVMKKYVREASLKDGLKRSRLPTFSKAEIEYIKGTADFIGLNVYSSTLVENDPNALSNSNTTLSRVRDAAIKSSVDPSWQTTIAGWFKVVPEGMRLIVNWVKRKYGDVPVIILENGYPDLGELRDVDRVRFYQSYLLELLKAIHWDKCNVIGYTAWSLLDNYEWYYGYKHKFGLFQVNFDHPSRPRTPKMSAVFYQKLIAENRVPKEDEISYW